MQPSFVTDKHLEDILKRIHFIYDPRKRHVCCREDA